MNVTTAVRSRFSARAFLSTPVASEVVREIVEQAVWAPSGGNLQPWHIHAVGGKRLEAFLDQIESELATHPTGLEAEYDVYPPKLKEPYRTRRFQCGEDLYASIDVPRSDRSARLRQYANNYRLFGAPVALFFCLDRTMGPPQWSDVGMIMQSVMLLARERGLHTCAQESWASWPDHVRGLLTLPDEMMLFSGLALGYADMDHPINQWRTTRAPQDEVLTVLGDDW